jgi:2-polyprenyl-6-methoxyphenol hydroxylase-like FAD-dependent oxidoreductase
MPQKPISVVGAGIAGLPLARALRKYGIAATIYERKLSSHQHQYGITLHPWAYRPLLMALDIDEHTFRSRVAVDGIGRIDRSKLLNTNGLTEDSLRTHRGKFEDLLREGLDVRWESGVDKVDRTECETCCT